MLRIEASGEIVHGQKVKVIERDGDMSRKDLIDVYDTAKATLDAWCNEALEARGERTLTQRVRKAVRRSTARRPARRARAA